jgi:hypothetical protein
VKLASLVSRLESQHFDVYFYRGLHSPGSRWISLYASKSADKLESIQDGNRQTRVLSGARLVSLASSKAGVKTSRGQIGSERRHFGV